MKGRKSSWIRLSALCLLSAMAGIAAHAQTFTTLVNFNGTNGANPTYGSLVEGINGDLYGTTVSGGSAGIGTVFRMSPQGRLKVLVSFDTSNGDFPDGTLLVAADGMLYGTTSDGGAFGPYGTIFQMAPDGTLTTLHSFDVTDGFNIYAGLAQAFGGALWGTALDGGAYEIGTIFKFVPSGALTTEHSFSGPDGSYPVGGLIQATNGMLYGMVQAGGVYGRGTIYSISLGGAFSTLYNFNGTDGAAPYGSLVQAADGNFYGTTDQGGTKDDGTVFRITPAGTLTTLHSFHVKDGLYPTGVLIQATDGNFYGTTMQGGANCAPWGCGTIFQITPAGKLTILHSFDGSNGEEPWTGLLQATDGDFYGTTWGGGSKNLGTVFRLSMGLGPFVKTVPNFGEAGATVTILGTDLTGLTSVTFSGIPATITAATPTAITTTVPAGATSGTVEVTTPQGMLSSNMPFQVLTR